MDLFISRAREITEDEEDELLGVSRTHGIRGHTQDEVRKLYDHEFFKLLGGNPHAVILAAPLLIKMRLKELYDLLSSSSMNEVLRVEGIQDSTVASLRVSLEASIQILEKEDAESYNFFFMLGMLPGGATGEELESMYGESWKLRIDTLFNLSLVTTKDGNDDKSSLYSMLPFMNKYAEAGVPEGLKSSY